MPHHIATIFNDVEESLYGLLLGGCDVFGMHHFFHTCVSVVCFGLLGLVSTSASEVDKRDTVRDRHMADRVLLVVSPSCLAASIARVIRCVSLLH